MIAHSNTTIPSIMMKHTHAVKVLYIKVFRNLYIFPYLFLPGSGVIKCLFVLHQLMSILSITHVSAPASPPPRRLCCRPKYLVYQVAVEAKLSNSHIISSFHHPIDPISSVGVSIYLKGGKELSGGGVRVSRDFPTRNVGGKCEYPRLGARGLEAGHVGASS